MLFVGLRCGMGPKQTSLFLRNVGWSWDVAILDVHVLSYMRLSRLASENSVATLTAYERLEDRLRAYALGRGEPLGRLDFAVWVVMRAASKEKVR
jgi:N-glycosylase/DNA lyase